MHHVTELALFGSLRSKITVSSKHSHLHQLLKLYLSSPQSFTPAPDESQGVSFSSIQSTSRDLVTHCLSTSLLFEHDPGEVDIWIDSLPKLRGHSSASVGEAATTSPLVGAPEACLAFFDECVLRCLKTPYRYIEENLAILPTYSPSELPSPIFITLLEQLAARTRTNLLPPSTTLEICTYIRRLLLGFLGKQPDVRYMQEMTRKLEVILESSKPGSAEESVNIWAACRTQVALLNQTILVFSSPLQVTPVATAPAVRSFLAQVEGRSIRTLVPLRLLLHLLTRVLTPANAVAQAKEEAFELVDWLQLNALPIQLDDLIRFANLINQRYPPALEGFFWHLHPEWGYLWEIQSRSPFENWCLPSMLSLGPLAELAIRQVDI